MKLIGWICIWIASGIGGYKLGTDDNKLTGIGLTVLALGVSFLETVKG